MSNFYLYALLSGCSGPVVPALEGLKTFGEAAQEITVEEFVLIYSAIEDEEMMPTRCNMLTHSHILEKLTEQATVLPMRFGMITGSIETVKDLIVANIEDIRAQAARLEDHVEIGLRMSFPREAALAHLLASDAKLRAGRAELQGKGKEAYFEQIDFGRSVAEALDRPRGDAQKILMAQFSAQARSYVLRAPESDVEVLRAEFLLPREALEGFAVHVLEQAASLNFCPDSEPDIQLVEPAPAYNFVNLSLDTALLGAQ